jgi:hypothetical protein
VQRSDLVPGKGPSIIANGQIIVLKKPVKPWSIMLFSPFNALKTARTAQTWNTCIEKAASQVRMSELNGKLPTAHQKAVDPGSARFCCKYWQFSLKSDGLP